MTQLPEFFNPAAVKPSEPMEAVLLPPAWYTVEVEAGDVKPTSNGTGTYIEYRFRVVAGSRTGAAIFNRYNVQNASAKAVEIGQRDLSALCASVDFAEVLTDTNQLLGRFLDVLVRIEPGTNGYGPKSVVKGHAAPGSKAASEANLAAQEAEVEAPAPTTAKQPAPTVTKPWAAGTAAAQPSAPPAQATAPAPAPAPTASSSAKPWEKPQAAAKPTGTPPAWAKK